MTEKSQTLTQQIKEVAPVFAIGAALMAVAAGGVFAIDAMGLMPTNPGARAGIELAPVFAFLAVMMKAPELMEAFAND